jgi:hypothetical protein
MCGGRKDAEVSFDLIFAAKRIEQTGYGILLMLEMGLEHLNCVLDTYSVSESSCLEASDWCDGATDDLEKSSVTLPS